MCKIMAIVGIDKGKGEQAERFAKAAVPHLTLHDNDAFGYAAVSESTGLYGERWINVEHGMRRRAQYRRADSVMQSAFGGIVEYPEQYNTFGKRSVKDTTAMILHGRMATCGGGIENAHPFVSGDAALIHNGIVYEGKGLRNVTSTCDSEMILNAYLDLKVDKDPVKNMQPLADLLDGYYACAVLTKVNGHWVVDIFREHQATLYAAYVHQIGAIVVCTKKKIIEDTCRDAKMDYYAIGEFEPENMIRLTAKNGNRIAHTRFESSGWAYGGYGVSGYSEYSGYRGPGRFSEWEYDDDTGGYRRLSASGETVSSISGGRSKGSFKRDDAIADDDPIRMLATGTGDDADANAAIVKELAAERRSKQKQKPKGNGGKS